MSRGIPEPKLTAVDAMIDKLTGAIFLFQIVVVIVLGIAGNVWKDTEARKVSNCIVFIFEKKIELENKSQALVEILHEKCNLMIIFFIYLWPLYLIILMELLHWYIQ